MRSGVRRTEFDLRPFLEPRERILDVDIGKAVADLYAFVLAISSKGFEGALRASMQGVETDQPGPELVTAIGEHLSHGITGLQAEVFCKAVEEAIFDAAGLGYDLQRLNVKAGLERYLRKRGAKQFLELFLSRYVFDAVWLRVQDHLRAKSGSRSLRKSAVGIERFCASVVRSVVENWHVEGKLERLPAKKRLGTTLIATIETRLLETTNAPVRKFR